MPGWEETPPAHSRKVRLTAAMRAALLEGVTEPKRGLRLYAG